MRFLRIFKFEIKSIFSYDILSVRICILCQQSDPYNKIRKTLVKNFK
ncbi:hypothetical protein ANHYDRO_00564 [Anaerococcus hydrogenalis DSM 7454]|uniref:Uncharacterized protein n=1 Tax=Anaerococcus hydrogenalis DSM 7454 TaxID=561177 RepID=B6W7L5_9FIRM|nr:hypothetical protein ANHYDRO_00564 [Anaerococcus hydrogenalis DSM 7454]